jgi:membrane-bound metal-dependent hydrolase YbcI (DUF457 family)
MFIGHFGIGFGLKRMAPRASLGLLIAATLWADILWTVFLLLGWEHARISVGDTRWTPLDLYDFPWSHSLLSLVLWATALAAVYRSYRDLAGAAAVWIGVVSHWVLDWLSHRPDMPLYPDGPKFGASLWNSIPGTLLVEVPLFAGGVWLYARCTRARDGIGRIAFCAYVAVLALLYLGDRFSAPPESIREIVITGLISIPLFLLWPWWFDRHREPSPCCYPMLNPKHKTPTVRSAIIRGEGGPASH